MTTTVTVTRPGGIWWRDPLSGAELGALDGERADLPADVAAALIAEGQVVLGAPPTAQERRDAAAAHNARQEAGIARYEAAVRRLETQAAHEMAGDAARRRGDLNELRELEEMAGETALFVAPPGEGGRPRTGGQWW